MILNIFHSKHIFMEIASEEEIIKIMSMSVDKNDKAIITLILSSGLPSTFIEKMTYKQLIYACNDYFKPHESKSIENLVRKNPINDNFIACFDFNNKSRPRMTCCSPESLQLIIEYLRYRKNIEVDSEKDYVFLNYQNEPLVGKDHISNLFRRSREKANRYTFDEVDIKSANVRNRFWHICENHLQGQHRGDVLVLMKGSKNLRNKNFYESVKDNKSLLREHYLTVVDYLTLGSNRNLDHDIDDFPRHNFEINTY